VRDIGRTHLLNSAVILVQSTAIVRDIDETYLLELAATLEYDTK
jgi:hypothetical protein